MTDTIKTAAAFATAITAAFLTMTFGLALQETRSYEFGGWSLEQAIWLMRWWYWYSIDILSGEWSFLTFLWK